MKPVSAGDTVTRPIVKIFMGDNSFDTLKIIICSGFRIGKQAGGIKNIQALVFHGAKIEMINRHNHEDIKIVFAAKHLLVPAHMPE